MKKDGYKITVKGMSDSGWREGVYYPIREFNSLKEILDYSMGRFYNIRTKPLDFGYFGCYDYEGMFFRGFRKERVGDKYKSSACFCIENVFYCRHCRSVSPKSDYAEFISKYSANCLICSKCGGIVYRRDYLKDGNCF
jgi:hypothetical protein